MELQLSRNNMVAAKCLILMTVEKVADFSSWTVGGGPNYCDAYERGCPFVKTLKLIVLKYKDDIKITFIFMYPLHTVIYEVFIYIFSSDWFQTCTIFISGWKDSVFSLFVLKPSYPNLQWPNPWMHSRDCWLVQAENNSPSKTHRAGYHTNRSIWAQQIAGFGCEWPSQIPSLISKKGHTPPTTHTAHNTHRLPFAMQRTSQRQ